MFKLLFLVFAVLFAAAMAVPKAKPQFYDGLGYGYGGYGYGAYDGGYYGGYNGFY